MCSVLQSTTCQDRTPGSSSGSKSKLNIMYNLLCGVWIYITHACQDKLGVYVMREENTLVP